MHKDIKECEYCNEVIPSKLRRCPFCGSLQKEKSIEVTYPECQGYSVDRVKQISNKKKVFLTVISSIIPGFGQLIGIIIAIVFMNSEEDPDKRSFGVALLVSSIIIFLFTCFVFFIFVLSISKLSESL